MIEKDYIQQLERFYPQYLRNLIHNIPFSPISLRGGKRKPVSTLELYSNIDSFLRYEKTEGKRGWCIEWGLWHSSTLGIQKWPVSVSVITEEDYLFLIGKQKEAGIFKVLIQQLLEWNDGIREWLFEKPQKILELKGQWNSICAVVDFLLQNDVQQYYVRSLPVPVHTKFIQQYHGTILSILKHLQPARFPEGIKSLETALGLQVKPSLFLIRWLDPELAVRYTSGIEVLSIPVADLQSSLWSVREVWVVENETNLYILPKRKNAMVIFSKGFALHGLSNIQLFMKCRLLYWGDLDESGFNMLYQFRRLYPNVQSIMMDERTVRLHLGELVKQPPYCLTIQSLQLADSEAKAFQLLAQENGRIEQERLKQDYIQECLEKMDA